MLRKALLICGILSSLLYAAANVVCAIRFEGYSSISQTVSELSAIGAPTRPLWVAIVIPYDVLLIAFGLGVWLSAGKRRALKITGAMLIAQGGIGFFWPPMHLRGAEFTVTDTLHIAFTLVTIPLMMVGIAVGAAAFATRFRIYSIVTLVVLIGFGTLTGIEGPNIAANLPTPLIGVWERISIGAFLLWVMVLATALLLKGDSSEEAPD